MDENVLTVNINKLNINKLQINYKILAQESVNSDSCIVGELFHHHDKKTSLTWLLYGHNTF